MSLFLFEFHFPHIFYSIFFEVGEMIRYPISGNQNRFYSFHMSSCRQFIVKNHDIFKRLEFPLSLIFYLYVLKTLKASTHLAIVYFGF